MHAATTETLRPFPPPTTDLGQLVITLLCVPLVEGTALVRREAYRD
jgi:hypothetical protein